MNRSLRAFSLVGMLVTLVCMLVLGVILMSSLNQAVTGGGSPKGGTVRSFKDELNLKQLCQVLFVAAQENDRLPTPSEVIGARDGAKNTTANLYSMLIAQQSISPSMLISGNEYNPHVWEKTDYDFNSYNPADGTYWDGSFRANLAEEAHVSFAHMPLFGKRFESHWRQRSMDSRFPLLGNRGPKDGQPDPKSYTYGRDGQWGGHVAYADGHVVFVDTFTPGGLGIQTRDGVQSDNLFHADEGEAGGDAVLAFTRKMSREGPVLQYD